MIKDNNLLLKKELKLLISMYAKDVKTKEIIECIDEEFTKRNMLGSRGVNLFTGNMDISILSNNNDEDVFILFVFTYAFYNALKNLGLENYEKINVDKYFTKVEIEEWKDYKIEKKEISRYPYVFKDVYKVADGHYRTVISSKYLKEIDFNNDINYNPKIQRNPKINVYGEKEINIDPKKIQTIKERLINKEQFSDDIRLNVMHDGFSDDVRYDEKTKTLTIYKGVISIFDGFHRKSANSLAMTEDENLDFTWGLVITNFSEKKAQSFMRQINEQTPIKKEYTNLMNEKKMENVILGFILEKPFEFSKFITDTEDEIKKNKGLTKKIILTKAIEECFYDEINNNNISESDRIISISDTINNVVNYIISLNYDAFIKNRNIIMTCKNIFVGYIALAKKVYGEENWKDEVKEVLKNIDFSQTNPIWEEIGLLSNKDATKPLREKLYKIFQNK